MSPVALDDVPAVLENYLVLGGQLEPLRSGRQSPPPSLLLRHLPSLQGVEGGQQEGDQVQVQVPDPGPSPGPGQELLVSATCYMFELISSKAPTILSPTRLLTIQRLTKDIEDTNKMGKVGESKT